jgi:hypothetical protein
MRTLRTLGALVVACALAATFAQSGNILQLLDQDRTKAAPFVGKLLDEERFCKVDKKKPLNLVELLKKPIENLDKLQVASQLFSYEAKNDIPEGLIQIDYVGGKAKTLYIAATAPGLDWKKLLAYFGIPTAGIKAVEEKGEELNVYDLTGVPGLPKNFYATAEIGFVEEDGKKLGMGYAEFTDGSTGESEEEETDWINAVLTEGKQLISMEVAIKGYTFAQMKQFLGISDSKYQWEEEKDEESGASVWTLMNPELLGKGWSLSISPGDEESAAVATLFFEEVNLSR